MFLCPPLCFQIHGDHPPPAAEADVHRDPCGDRCDLDAGPAPGLPPVLLLRHGPAARAHSLLHRLARVHHRGLQEDVSPAQDRRGCFQTQTATQSL